VGRPEASGGVLLRRGSPAAGKQDVAPGRTLGVPWIGGGVLARCVSSSLTSGTAENSRNGVGLIGTSMDLTSVFAGRRNVHLLLT
jgi:hypothetical protein